MRDGGFTPVIECNDFPTCSDSYPRENLGYVDFVINSVIKGPASSFAELSECPFERCYDPAAAIPIPLTVNRARCCLPVQTKVPSVVGGKFSTQTKSAESLADATSIWNPGCSDTLNFVAYYINLLQSSVGHEMRQRGSYAITTEQGSAGALRAPQPETLARCGSVCTAEKPYCKPIRVDPANISTPLRGENRAIPYPAEAFLYCTNTNGGDSSQCPTYDTGYECEQPECSDVAEYCGSSLPVGVRARQICPITCGCDSPRSTLALYLPSAGCPPSCWKTTRYRDEMATTPCADLPRNDTTFVAFLDAWATAADVWPKDWQESGLIYVDMFRRFGCHYLYMNSATDAEYGWEDTSVTLQPSYHSGSYTNPSYANFSNPDGSYTDPGILGPGLFIANDARRFPHPDGHSSCVRASDTEAWSCTGACEGVTGIDGNGNCGPLQYPTNPSGLFWPAHFGAGVSPCMENGFYYPVKPLSYFCPVACGCRAGDKHCPDTCPARINEPNEFGQVNYVGNVGGNSWGGSNPSPRNVANFPWRIAETWPGMPQSPPVPPASPLPPASPSPPATPPPAAP